MVRVEVYGPDLLDVLEKIHSRVEVVSSKFLKDVPFSDYIHWKYSRGRTWIFRSGLNALAVLSEDANALYKGKSWGIDAVSLYKGDPSQRWAFAGVLLNYLRMVRGSGEQNLVVCEPRLDETMAKAGYSLDSMVYLFSARPRVRQNLEVVLESVFDYSRTVDWSNRVFASDYYRDRVEVCPISRYYRCAAVKSGRFLVGKVLYRVDESEKRVVVLDWAVSSYAQLPSILSVVIEFEGMDYADFVWGGREGRIGLKLGFRVDGTRNLRVYPARVEANRITALDLDLEELLW